MDECYHKLWLDAENQGVYTLVLPINCCALIVPERHVDHQKILKYAKQMSGEVYEDELAS